MTDGEREVRAEAERDARETEEGLACELAAAREALATLEETERFLMNDAFDGGKLRLDVLGKWGDDVRETRRLIADQKAAIARMEAAAGL